MIVDSSKTNHEAKGKSVVATSIEVIKNSIKIILEQRNDSMNEVEDILSLPPLVKEPLEKF